MREYKIDDYLAEETGIHVGDGSMNIYSGKKHLYTLACHKIDDKEYMDNFILPLMQRIYGLTPKPRAWSKGTYGFRISSRQVVQFKHHILGLPLGKKTEISIPKLIYQDKKLMQSFLRGLFDTDGSLYLWRRRKEIYPRIYFGNVSEQLVHQVKTFLLQEGFKLTYWKAISKHRNWNDLHRICLNGNKMITKWADEIGFSNPKNIKKLDILGVKHKIL
jgi:hypothetical protein